MDNPFEAFGQQHGRKPAVRVNPADAVSGFIAAMEAAGLKPLEPIASRLGHGLVRFRCEGDNPGKANGWAVLHLDEYPAGAFGNWKAGISEKWRVDGNVRLSPSERRARAARFREERDRREAEILASQQSVARQCAERWEKASPTNPRHPYLVAKGIGGEGSRQEGNRLLIPMRDHEGVLWNLQTIAPDGTKRFAKGGRQKGLLCLLGHDGPTLVVAEGFGTGAVIRRATGHSVAIAFSSGNMVATALAIRDAYPDSDIIVAADDDPHLVANPNVRRNVGLIAAHEAAAAVGGRVAVPPTRSAA